MGAAKNVDIEADVPQRLKCIAERLVEFRPDDERKTVSIYFLCSNDEVVYVGQAVDMFNRMKAHREKIFDRIFHLKVKKEISYETERSIIKALRPKYNKERFSTCEICDMERGRLLTLGMLDIYRPEEREFIYSGMRAMYTEYKGD
jgi:predicted GIY-YIG superfamily endonuclease